MIYFNMKNGDIDDVPLYLFNCENVDQVLFSVAGGLG